MLLGWKSPIHMRAGLPRSALREAHLFYSEYLRLMYGSPEDEKSDEDEAPWDAEVIVGELT